MSLYFYMLITWLMHKNSVTKIGQYIYRIYLSRYSSSLTKFGQIMVAEELTIKDNRIMQQQNFHCFTFSNSGKSKGM